MSRNRPSRDTAMVDAVKTILESQGIIPEEVPAKRPGEYTPFELAKMPIKEALRNRTSMKGNAGYGQRLDQAILSRGRRPADVARATGFARATISQHLEGLNYPAPATLAKIAAALNVDPGDLYPDYGAKRSGTSAFDGWRLRQSETPGEMILEVNASVPTELAMKIAEMLDAANRS